MRMNNETVERTWIREDTLTMLLAIPLVLCIIYIKNDKYTMVQYDKIQKTMPYMYYTCTVCCKCQTCGLTSADRGHINMLVDQWSYIAEQGTYKQHKMRHNRGLLQTSSEHKHNPFGCNQKLSSCRPPPSRHI